MYRILVVSCSIHAPRSEQLRALDASLDCRPEAIPSIAEDRNLGTIDPITGLAASGFRRGVGERAGPPYIGRGLMEAVPTQDIVNAADPDPTPEAAIPP